MGERTEDGKIRIRCPGCGKRVKFPADQVTHAFRCPMCGVTIVPKGDKGESDSSVMAAEVPQAPRETVAFARRLVRRMADHEAAPDEREAPVSPLGAKEPERLPVIALISNFMNRENQRVARMSMEIVNSPLVPVDVQATKLKELRRAKAYHFKQFVDETVKNLDAEIAALRDNPASETQTVKEKLNSLAAERRGMMIFLSVMFEMRPLSQPATPGDAKPAAPGTASAPPTKA